MLNKTFSKISVFGLTIVALVACGKSRQALDESSKRAPDAPEVMVTETDTAPTELPVAKEPAHKKVFKKANQKAKEVQATPADTAAKGTVTFKKSRLFNREFLYGFDLQYSSGADEEYELIPQTEALGHVPCFFRQIGKELQLVADQSRQFESNVNHPELLLQTYQVVGETRDTLTVKVEASGLIVNEAYNGKGSLAPKKAWLRSLEYVARGDYLLQETGLLLANGTVQTFLESVFPRSSIVPEGYKGLEGKGTELADRYRFITGETVYVDTPSGEGETVRTQTTFASRFHLGENGTIDWYVTPNVPDRFLGVMKSGIEGWNRYFEPQLGRKVVRFMGKLPQGVKIGDPRYNVVNFDSVAEAGAAYESQAIDPMTGIQSHSLVYMPLAWYNIGISLWSRRTDTSRPSAEHLMSHMTPKGTDVLFGASRKILRCMRAADEVVTPAHLLAESILSPANVPTPTSLDEFGKRLMISTLFHEIGHALGLDHNFKGSLAFDGSRPSGEDNPTSWSVMDYNYYQNEMDLFEEIGGTAGPALEYDRQIISQLYNDGADVKGHDPVIPACNDEETDDVAGGQDPFCVRYDAEMDPSLGVEHSLHNLTAASGSLGIENKTMAQMIADLNEPFATKFASATEVPDVQTAKDLAAELGDKVGMLSTYFIASGAQSLRVNLRNNARALRTFKEGTIADELTFRTRYATALKTGLALTDLPEAPNAAVMALAQTVKDAIGRNPALGTDSTLGDTAANAIKAAVSDAAKASLSRLRTDAYANFAFDLTMPFALVMTSGGELSHFETLAVDQLALGSVRGLDGTDFADFAAERETAVTTLATFKGVSPKPAEVVTALEASLAQGLEKGDADLVSEARKLLKILKD